jgi:hypothetical protein
MGLARSLHDLKSLFFHARNFSAPTLSIPEPEQTKTAVLNTLTSEHSRRIYGYDIEKVYLLVLQRT